MKFGCQKPIKYGQFMFYETVKVDMENSKETSFNNTISSTHSLITVLFEDLFETINCCKPPRHVPYKRTYVLYNGTFGASD